MTGPVSRVVVKTEAYVRDPAGRRLRGDLFVDALVPSDPDRSIPIVGSFASNAEHLRSDYLSRPEGRLKGWLLRRRGIDCVRHAERFELPGSVETADNQVFDYELPTWTTAAIPPHVQGPAFLWNQDDDLKVLVMGDAEPRISGRRTTKGYDFSAVHETAAATRASAREHLLQRPDGLYVSAPTPCIRLHQSGYGGWQIAAEVVNHTVADEMMFSIDRVDEADAFARRLRHSDYGTTVRGVVLVERALLPPGPSDLERIAIARAPEVAAIRSLDPFQLPSELVHAWHDAAGAPAIVAEEGLPGAVRIMDGVVRLIAHQKRVAPDYSGGFDLERLRMRTVFEIDLLPRPAVEGPRT